MLKIKEAPALAEGQRKSSFVQVYSCHTKKASRNHNSGRLPVRELLGREIVNIWCYLQNPHLNNSEREMALRIFESTLRKYFALHRKGVGI